MGGGGSNVKHVLGISSVNTKLEHPLLYLFT